MKDFWVDNNNYVRFGEKPSSGSDEGLIPVLIIGISIVLIMSSLSYFGISVEDQLNYVGKFFQFIGWIISCVWWAVSWIVWGIFHPHTILAYLAFSKVFWLVLGSIAISFWFGTTTYLIAKLFCK